MSMKSIVLAVAALSAVVAQPVFAQSGGAVVAPGGATATTVLPTTVFGVSTGVVAFGSVALLTIVEGAKSTTGTTGTK